MDGRVEQGREGGVLDGGCGEDFVAEKVDRSVGARTCGCVV